MKLLVATRSRGKIGEIRELLRGFPPLQITTPDELGIEPAPEEEEVERFDTFRGNAIAKATYFARLSGLPTIADDSGIVVDALDGAPGVRSKRFASDDEHYRERILEGLDQDEANNQLLLERLAGVTWAERGAHYACVLALATPEKQVLTTVGTVSGRITEEPRGTGGFGYDPLFHLDDLGLTFGEVDALVKNRRSHRARALNALRAVISDVVETP